jgi:hypothetical protein
MFAEDRRAPARGVVVAALVVAAGIAAGGCDRGAPPAPPAKCPARFTADGGRQGRILERLRATGEGARVLSRWAGPVSMCFGPARPSALTEEGVLLMEAAEDEARAAARAAHLIAHLADGLPALVAGKGDCERRVEQALAAEARGLSVELRVGRELGAPPAQGGPFEVEAVYWQAPPEEREAALVGYLRAHPEGAPGVDALAAGYAKRCAAGGVGAPASGAATASAPGSGGGR